MILFTNTTKYIQPIRSRCFGLGREADLVLFPTSYHLDHLIHLVYIWLPLPCLQVHRLRSQKDQSPEFLWFISPVQGNRTGQVMGKICVRLENCYHSD